ncbi:hypothetical protein VKT23_015923 [Stygiomarasmius scandens]|uniref:Uncharacterized protein n=1 Tax=Marasmiellus scandens TaxID=2682957 RepID=A0ABR1IZ78_9AGAR
MGSSLPDDDGISRWRGSCPSTTLPELLLRATLSIASRDGRELLERSMADEEELRHIAK